jgi:hypothetical protein
MEETADVRTVIQFFPEEDPAAHFWKVLLGNV